MESHTQQPILCTREQLLMKSRMLHHIKALLHHCLLCTQCTRHLGFEKYIYKWFNVNLIANIKMERAPPVTLLPSLCPLVNHPNRLSRLCHLICNNNNQDNTYATAIKQLWETVAWVVAHLDIHYCKHERTLQDTRSGLITSWIIIHHRFL